jgi:nicotinamidase-related amidase
LPEPRIDNQSLFDYNVTMAKPMEVVSRRGLLTGAAALAEVGTYSPAHAAQSGDQKRLVDISRLKTRRLAVDETLIPEKTALVMVDMMNRFCDPKWLSQGNPESERYFASELDTIIPKIKQALDAFRTAHAPIVHVVNAKWTQEGREVVPYQRGRDYDLFDTPAMSVISPLAPRRGEIVIRKVASSAFTGTGLEFLLRNAGVQNIVLSGQYGNACVFYTLIQSRELGFSNYWLDDGILYGTALHKELIEALVGAHWAKLVSAKEIKGTLRA